MFSQDDNIKEVLIQIIELLGYLVLGITIWELTKNFLVILIYVLILAFLVLLLRYRSRFREVEKLRRILGKAGQSADELQRVRRLFEGMLGLFMSTVENPLADIKHHYTFIQEEYIIHGDDGIYNWIIQGHNVLDEPSSGITIKFSGDTPVDVSSLALSVSDRATGRRYDDNQIRTVKDLPYLKIFELVFLKPLQKGEGFDLNCSCRWNNTFTQSRKYDYVFFPWGYDAIQGIDKFVGRLVCDLPITDFTLQRIDAGRLINERSQPKLLDTSNKHFVLEWEISNPRSVYLLRFTKEIGDVSRGATGGYDG